MMFQKKIDKAIELQKAKNREKFGDLIEDEENSDDSEQLDIELEPLEKKDLMAMIISALLIFVPIFIIIFGGIALIASLFF